MKSSSYKPRFFTSLIQSCYGTEFYTRIKDISFIRSIGFLTLFSLLVSVMSLIILAVFWSQLFPSSEGLLQSYDQSFPEFEAIYEDSTLDVSPKAFSVFLDFDSDGNLLLRDQPGTNSLLRFSLDTEKSLEEAIEDAPQSLGVYLYRNGLYAVTGFQDISSHYSDFDFKETLSFNRKTLRLFIQSAYPIAQEWIKNALFVTGPMLIFLYHFLGGWILAFFFSLIGIVVLKIMGKEVRYRFLLRLSFYATVPAFLLALLTALFSISVSFLPIIVYAAYYYYGLRVYQTN